MAARRRRGMIAASRALAAHTDAFGDPFVLAANGFVISAFIDADLKDFAKSNSDPEEGRKFRIDLSVARIPQHQAVIGVVEAQSV